jgi:DNA-binding NarL/FixJ family response regulator
VALLRQTFALVLERWTGLRTVQADSPAAGSGLLADLDGDIALAVVSVDTADGPDTRLIQSLHERGLPVLAFGLEESTDGLSRALKAGADDAISLGAPVTQFVGKARQLAKAARFTLSGPAVSQQGRGPTLPHENTGARKGGSPSLPSRPETTG